MGSCLFHLIVYPLGVILVESWSHDCRLPTSPKSKTRCIDRNQRIRCRWNPTSRLLLQLVLCSECIFINQGVQEWREYIIGAVIDVIIFFCAESVASHTHPRTIWVGQISIAMGYSRGRPSGLILIQMSALEVSIFLDGDSSVTVRSILICNNRRSGRRGRVRKAIGFWWRDFRIDSRGRVGV